MSDKKRKKQFMKKKQWTARSEAPVKPIQHRLLVPLSGVLLLLAWSVGIAFVNMHQNNLQEINRLILENASDELAESLAEQSDALAALGWVIISDAELRKALETGNRDKLLALSKPMFTRLREEHAVTHFYFHRPDRTNLLRVYRPGKHGDLITRFTAREAERTRAVASGIELGSLGTFTLRSVRPVLDGDALIGYLELGKEIEDILATLHKEQGIETGVTIFKKALDRTKWEAGMTMLGRDADWGRYADKVLIYSSLPRFPSECDHFIAESLHKHNDVSNAEIKFNDATWRVLVSPIRDASGTEVGDLIIMNNITGEKAAFARVLTIASLGGLILLAGLFRFLFIILRRTDEDIRMQQAALAESESFLRSLTGALPDFIFVLDKNGAIQKVNRVFPGHRDADVIGHKADTFVPSEYRGAFEKALREAISTGQIQTVETTMNIPDAHPFFLNRLVPVSLDNEDSSIVLIATDITKRRRAEETLRATRDFQKRILETVATAVFTVDSEQIITGVNREFCNLTGFSKTEIVGQHCGILCNDPCMTICGFHNHESTQPIFRRQCEIRRKDGRRMTILKNADNIRDEAGNITGEIESFIDVTELVEARELAEETSRQLEEAIAQTNTMAVQAELANMTKSEFLANMSHEIRTPMNGVIGMTGLLLDTELTDEQRKYADIVRTSGESLLALINDILDFSKIEAGKLELEILDFDLRTTLEDISQVLALKAHEKGLELTAFVHPEVPSLLRGDPGRLRQIIVNLAGNAVKFTHKGEVNIRADLKNENEQEALVCFTVTDTGIGIPSDSLDALFKPFTQADGSTTRKYGGTGLGLSISKQLSELMGGEIGIRSQEGEGSSFWFTARFEKQTGETGILFESAAEIRNVRVLVVDDYESNRLLVSTLLDSWGCQSEEAVDGAAALAKLNEGMKNSDPFRVALLDMQMPEMDGEELGRRIKADPQISETILIMMTSFGQRGDAKRLEKVGFAAYLPKPVRKSQLHDCLALALGIRQEGEGKTTSPGIITQHTLSEAKKKRIRILLAEDNSTNQLVALAILNKLGYRADAVGNGKEALEALRTLPYDLVLMDCQMPVMDGYEATRKIRQETVKNPDVPVIAMTANAMKGDREKCLEAGMNDYIPKPVNPQEIAETLERWLAPQDESDDLKSETAATGKSKKIPKTNNQIPDIFDHDELLNRLMGDENLVEMMIKVFLNDMPGQIMALKTSVEKRQADQVYAQGHKIKGMAANIGSPALWEIADNMEAAGKAGDMETLDTLMPELEKRFIQLKEVIMPGK